MLNQIIEAISGQENESEGQKKIKGTLVLMKKNVLDFNDFIGNSILDGVHELFGKKVSLQLVSAVHGDPGN